MLIIANYNIKLIEIESDYKSFLLKLQFMADDCLHLSKNVCHLLKPIATTVTLPSAMQHPLSSFFTGQLAAKSPPKPDLSLQTATIKKKPTHKPTTIHHLICLKQRTSVSIHKRITTV
ncbi:hypothetical protein NPIL_168661 [Nephila pilipes]|uniref:Uncharacterized protein n=1 Tax=Nephila pilipes TaxID=299642 RepID=A0A8X6NSB1_NEPPI|nr:hypothetical protein NPIL_168661 [Nephila pilipes]